MSFNLRKLNFKCNALQTLGGHEISLKYQCAWHLPFKRPSSSANSSRPSEQILTNSKFKTSTFLASKIKTSGPVTVAEFMKSVLTNPISGYYMKKDVFGTEGDFITSPEISQLFGEISDDGCGGEIQLVPNWAVPSIPQEKQGGPWGPNNGKSFGRLVLAKKMIGIWAKKKMIALWFVNEWTRIGSPKPMQIIELGPGRGTMMTDLLRVFDKLNRADNISCHLVEVSSKLSQLQAEALCVTSEVNDSNSLSYRSGVSHSGIPVHWYYSFQDVPRQFSCVVAHEFFDALPIHKFQKTENGWREVLIDLDPDNPLKFRYVISRMATPASAMFVKEKETREHVEVCPDAGVIAQQLAQRLEEDGGIALIADYGHTGDKTDTFRAFRRHKLHDPLIEPGTADLTADVDFNYLQDVVSDKLFCFGPVTQRKFLLGMHIEKRLEMLLASCKSEKEISSLKTGFQMMTDEEKMGCCFKFLALYPLVLKDYLTKKPPPGFV